LSWIFCAEILKVEGGSKRVLTGKKENLSPILPNAMPHFLATIQAKDHHRRP